MLFDIGWPELLLIGAVALVVIGPKDLPRALRIAGFWVRKARTLSREFQSSIDQMIREAELDEVRDDLKKATEFDVEKELREAIDPDHSLAQSIKPPELPDYFEEAEGPKPVTAEPYAALPAPTETPLAQETVAAEKAPEAAEPANAIPEPAEHAAEPPEPAPMPRPPAP
ncbi:MAG TPA: Sec-independent protein translocase protein TatB [Stellaceae bacterium]|nr:Sec-independent protein translocase protein TatB [Stellaceae bacterium]